MESPHQNTVAVQLTPAGRGAVAVVLVAGPQAVRAVEDSFHPAGAYRLTDIPGSQICYGRWGAADGEDIIVVGRPIGQDPFSERVEVQCHGGQAAVRAVIEALVKRGCTEISWQEWLAVAETDPIRSAAGRALAAATTTRVARILLDQYHGALRTAIEAAGAALEQGDGPLACQLLDRLLACRELGQHLTVPWRVVLTGPTNVGKSSLINALVGYARAIVCELPGTTRDVVTATTAIDGWPVELADTAGLRSTGDELESEGIRRARAWCAAADLVVKVVDVRQVPNQVSSPGALDVLNKIDLLDPRDCRLAGSAGDQAIYTSALTGAGIGDLAQAIGDRLVPNPPPVGAGLPFTSAQTAALERARVATARGDLAAARQELLVLRSC